jgi:hypothetical protein
MVSRRSLVRIRLITRDAYRSAALIALAIRIADTIVTRPGRMKLWSSTRLPIRVVPVWSKATNRVVRLKPDTADYRLNVTSTTRHEV